MYTHRYRATHGGRSHRDRWIAALYRHDLHPVVKVICVVENDSEAKRVEVALIALYRRRGCRLTNHTDGGEGGKNPDEVARLRMSEASKKKWTDPELRARMEKSIRASRKNPDLLARLSKAAKLQPKRKASEETRARLVAAWIERRKSWTSPLLGKPRSSEVCKRISESKRGVPRSAATVQKVRATRKSKFASGEYASTYQRNLSNGRFVKKENS